MLTRITGLILIYVGGFVTGFAVCYDRIPAPRIEIRRIVAPVRPADIITCPVTPRTVQELYIACRQRARAGAVKGD